jgi:hypothetical protein
MIKKFFKDITGVTAREEAARIAILEKEEKAACAAAKRKAKKEKEAEAKLSPKEIANKRKEAWVDVIGFKVNKDNIRNGFYELDWNEYFITELKQEGYGFDGDPDEEIVARWFRDICINAAAAEGVDMDNRETGYINVTKLTGGKAEVK